MRPVLLNPNQITDVTQPVALFTSDQVSLLQLIKNWGREETRDREDNHTLAHTLDREYKCTHLRSRGTHRCEGLANQG